MKKAELKKLSRSELVRMAEGARVPHTGTDEQLIERLAVVGRVEVSSESPVADVTEE